MNLKPVDLTHWAAEVQLDWLGQWMPHFQLMSEQEFQQKVDMWKQQAAIFRTSIPASRKIAECCFSHSSLAETGKIEGTSSLHELQE